MPFGSGQGDQYVPLRLRFNCRGLNVNVPANFLEPGFFPYFANARISQEGQMTNRGGISVLSNGHPNFHSLFRLSDIPADDYNYFAGVGTSLKFGKAGLAVVETVYSGAPLIAVECRPERSPSPRLYLTDGSVMRKVNVAGVAQQWGIFPPKNPPSVDLSPAESTSITDCTSANPEAVAENGAVWARQQNATVAMTQVNRTNTTIAAIIYDSGIVGYANISPTAMGTDIQPGTRIRINSGGGTDEFVIIEQTFPAIKDTTIESIVYHSGTAGLCTIQLSTPTTGLVANTMVRINSAENVRVLSVTNGPDGKPCFRCVTSGTFAATQTVTGFRNFRAFTANNHAAAETLITKAYEFQIDPDNAAPLGIGAVSHNINLDLSSAGGRPITDDDEISIGLYFAEIDRLIEGKVMIDLDPGTAVGVYAAGDLTRNYLFYPFRREDLQRYASPVDATTQLQASREIIQFRQIDQFNQRPVATIRDPITGAAVTFDELVRFRNTLAQGTGFVLPDRARRQLLQRYDEALGDVGQGGGILTTAVEDSGEFQAGSGKEQWYQLRFKVGDLVRVGTDQSQSLKLTTSFRLQLNLSGTTATVIRLSSVWIGGTYGPDSEVDSDLLGDAYYYRYVGRNSITGETGLPSPPTRAGVIGRRQKRTVSFIQHPDTQVDKLDIYRYGGSILQWTYIGTVGNTLSPTFVDNLGDEEITSNPILSFENFPPVPTVDLPRTGNCNVTGTRVTRTSGDFFNTNYSAGIEVVINGRTFLAYASPESQTILELTESAGTVAGGTFELPSATIMGQPLPTVFGPFGQGEGGLFYFFVGDPVNPGTLYWTNANDPNSVSDLNFIEITGPSEPLVTGCIYDNQPFVGSTERMFRILLNTNPQPGESQFIAREVANSKGMWTRRGICVDTNIYFVGKDGIYESEGGQPRSITDDLLYPLFSHEGLVGGGMDFIGATGLRIPAPDYRRPDSMTLVGDGQFVYFTYQDTNASWFTLVWEKRERRWLFDVYGDGGVRTIFVDKNIASNFVDIFSSPFYLLCGTANGTFGVLGQGNLDASVANPIPFRVLYRPIDFEDSRAEKRLGDIMLDARTGGDAGTLRIWKDNFSSAAFISAFQSNNRANSVIDLNSGEEIFAVNEALDYSQNVTNLGTVELYEWQPTAVPKPPTTFLRATDWDQLGTLAAKFLQGVLIEADTEGVAREVRIESADGGLIAVLSVNHDRQEIKAYSFQTPQIGSSFRAYPVDPANWKLYNIEFIWEPAPEAANVWQTQTMAGGGDSDSMGTCGWFITREAYIVLDSTAVSTFSVNLDGVTETYSIPSTGGIPQKVYLPLRARKGKLVSYRLESAIPFRLYKRDLCVLEGAWGRTTELTAVKPFGGPSRADGARI